MSADDRFKPEAQDFEKRFNEQMSHALEKLDGLPPDARAKTEDQIRQRFRRFENEHDELERKEPDFDNPSTQGKSMSLIEFVHFDADQIADRAVAAQHGKDKPEFEQWWRDQARNELANIDRLPPEARTKTEDQIRAHFFKFENERAALAKNEPDFNNPSTQAKHTSLLQRLNRVVDWTAEQALKENRAKEIADQFKAREAAQGNDREREP